MSYKIQIMDEYSFGQWFDDPLRFATEAEAQHCLERFPNAGWNGIQDLRVMASDEPENARWNEKGLLKTDGTPFYSPPPPPTPKKIRAEPARLSAKWDELVASLDSRSHK